VNQITTKDHQVINLTLKRANAFRSSGQWKDEDYDVLADSKVIGPHPQEGSARFSRLCRHGSQAAVRRTRLTVVVR
jgi:hypothetical protein